MKKSKIKHLIFGIFCLVSLVGLNSAKASFNSQTTEEEPWVCVGEGSCVMEGVEYPLKGYTKKGTIVIIIEQR